jgi:PAS domain S-box-containing protein
MAWSLDAQGKVEFLNRRWTEYSGVAADRAVANPNESIHPQDFERVQTHWLESFRRGEPFEDELRLRRWDGQYRWFLVRTTPARDDSGRILRWYGTSTDIEDRKLAEEAVAEGRRLLDLVLATLPVGVTVCSQSGEVILINAAAERIWGEGEPVLVTGERSSRTLYWHGTDKVIEPHERVSAKAGRLGSTTLGQLVDFEAPDGSRRTIENSAVPVRNAAGEIVGAVIVNIDMTEQVRASRALGESAAQTQRLSRRLLEVQEAERRHLSRELHDEFGQLLAAVSLHVQAARGSAGTALPSLETCASLLKEAGVRLRKLVLDLRPIMLETAGLDATLSWLAEQHRRQTGMAVHLGDPAGELGHDAAIACFRVVQEALTNALRHARASNVWIDFSRQGTDLVLAVRDDGTGFDVQDILSRAASEGHVGLLGMRERVEICGGSLSVESAPGQGTALTVRLPASHGLQWGSP